MRPEVQLFLLLLAVPAQYLISKWMTPDAPDREYLTRRILSDSANVLRKVTNISEWGDILNTFKEKYLFNGEGGECAAKEVMLYNEPNGYFSGSPQPREERKNIKYRIGQVIKHKKYGYRGVIVGWDRKTKAPDYWIQVNHFDPNWRHQPNYSVLVDTRDREDVQTTYVVEENMDIVTETEVRHPEVEEYFEHFDGSQYKPRPFLKTLYPND